MDTMFAWTNGYYSCIPETYGYMMQRTDGRCDLRERAKVTDRLGREQFRDECVQVWPMSWVLRDEAVHNPVFGIWFARCDTVVLANGDFLHAEYPECTVDSNGEYNYKHFCRQVDNEWVPNQELTTCLATGEYIRLTTAYEMRGFKFKSKEVAEDYWAQVDEQETTAADILPLVF